MLLRAVQMRGAHLSKHLGSKGRATGMLGRGVAPSLEVGVYKNHGREWTAPAVLSRPPPDPSLSFQPSTSALAGRPLTASCSRLELVWTLLLPPLGVSSSCHARFQQLRALLLVRTVYSCLLASVRVVFVMKRR